jgi:hypothetical protein
MENHIKSIQLKAGLLLAAIQWISKALENLSLPFTIIQEGLQSHISQQLQEKSSLINEAKLAKYIKLQFLK